MVAPRSAPFSPFLYGISAALLRGASPLRASLGVRGEVSLHVNTGVAVRLDAAGARVELAPGDVAMLRRDGAASPIVEAREGGDVELLSVSYGDCSGEASEAECVVHLAAHEVANDSAVHGLVSLLRAEIESGAGDGRAARSLMDALSAFVLRAHARRAENGARPSGPVFVRDRRILRALEAMTMKPAERWTLNALAKAAGLSRAQFVRRFSEQVGEPPLRYLTEWRLRLAMDLLANGDESLASIAARVGYESEFAFSRAFKRFTGEAPGSFRRRLQSRQSRPVAMAA